MRGDGSSYRPFRRKLECGVDGFACIRMFFILIYVLYKSRSLTLVTMIYSWDVL